MELKEIGKSIGKAAETAVAGAKQHAPEICVTLGIIAGVGAVVTAVTGTIKAKKLIEEKKAELKVDKLTVGETVKTVWKCYIPAVSLVAASTVSIASGAKISIDRTAVMGAVYNVGREAFIDHQKATEEVVGEETKKEIDKKAADKRENKEEYPEPVCVDGVRKYKFYEPLNSAYYIMTESELTGIAQDFNEMLLEDECLSANDWFTMLPGGKECYLGSQMFWSRNRDGLMRYSIGYGPDDEGKPCYIIRHLNPPKYED